MKTLLQLNSSLFSAGGQSTALAARFVAAWRAAHPGAQTRVRDLAADPVPHLTAERFGAFLEKPEARSAGQQAVVRYSDALIDELKAADVIALALPMYNFGVPSTLKAYFDHIARAGITFQYTAEGPVGLLTGKKVWVFAARGGVYTGTALDTQTAYVRDFLGFIGLTDVEFVYAEGLAVGDASRQASISAANKAIDAVVQREWRAAA